jgi:hypothetical protein
VRTGGCNRSEQLSLNLAAAGIMLTGLRMIGCDSLRRSQRSVYRGDGGLGALRHLSAPKGGEATGLAGTGAPALPESREPMP